MKIEYIEIDKLKENPNNAKIHTYEQIQEIKKSIKEFGMIDPIGVWHDEIVEGHGRVIACRELGMEEVPIIRLEHLSEDEKEAYGIVHNQLTLNTGFDYDKIDAELENIKIDMSDYGFGKIEWDDIDTIDSWEEPEKPKKRCPLCGHVDVAGHFKKVPKDEDIQ